VFNVTLEDDLAVCDATIVAMVGWFKEILTYDTLKNLGVKKEDLKLMAEETIHVGGLGQNSLAAIHPLSA
jgi:butanol dehydrogenase